MTLADDLRGAFLTSELTDAQLDELMAAGEVVEFAPDVEVFREGRTADQLWILLDGQIELSRRVGDETTIVATMSQPGQWAGGLAAWGDGKAVYMATGRVVSAARLFSLPAEELARLVGEWLPFGKHIISGVYQTIRSIDAGARQRESLVALGTLAAGLAHEINNPASASLRTVEALQGTGSAMLTSLVDLAREGIGADQFIELDRLRLELREHPPVDEGALARADREEVVGEWLDGRDIAQAWHMAPALAAFGATTDWLARVESVVGRKALGPAIGWVSNALGSAALLAELSEATTRISNLVEDVKNYSQMDHADLQTTDLKAGIESTLVMLAPKLAGIDVVREYAADVPMIDVYAGELNQVWTNLIDNALDAMGGAGTLRLSTAVDGGDVVVEVSDTGAGIDADVLERVFEPFFTTKDVGKGTGLGLDITRRIVVDRHRGHVDFESVPGATTARVRLPIRH